MALQALSGMSDLWLPGKWWYQGGDTPIDVDISNNAANASTQFIGQLYLPGHTGSKVISAAGGGAIAWVTGTTSTFADTTGTGTTFQVGIQNVDESATIARGTGTFDVYKTLTAGTDTLSAASLQITSMGSGTKTIFHGDKIAVVFQMTTRGSAATDNVQVKGVAAYASTGGVVASTYMQRPATTRNSTGASFVVSNSSPNVAIVFDDGTIGTLDGSFFSSLAAMSAGTTFTSLSTPDEYAMVFQTTFPCKIDALYAVVSQVTSSSAYELILYGDPEGTPTVLYTETVPATAEQAVNVYRGRVVTLPNQISLTANTKYAIAVRPTTNNSVGIKYFQVPNSLYWATHSLGSNCYLSTRTNQTGAFSATPTQRPLFAFRISALDDGTAVGSGGGGMRLVGAGGLVA